MKLCLLVLILALGTTGFCPLVQQTLSANAPALQPATFEVEDSDAYFQKATARKTGKDFSKEVAELVSRMTLEEKVGQMTQLEIGMITKG